MIENFINGDRDNGQEVLDYHGWQQGTPVAAEG
jgi:hypothetical protein